MSSKESAGKSSLLNWFMMTDLVLKGGSGWERPLKASLAIVRAAVEVPTENLPNSLTAEPPGWFEYSTWPSGKLLSIYEATQHYNSFRLTSSKTVRFTENMFVRLTFAAAFVSINNRPFRLGFSQKHIQLFIKCPLFCPVSTKIGRSWKILDIVKIKVTLEQATKAQRKSRRIALFFL